MAITRTGTLGLVWTEGVTEFSQIYFSSYNGGTWSPKVLLSNSKFYSGYPSIAVDSKGDFHVVWYGFDGISYQIYYTRWDGSSWSAPLDLSALKQDSLNPSIAIDSGNNVYVAWYAEVVHNYQVFFTYNSGNWSRTVPLTVATVDSSNPALTVEPDGRLNLVWVSTIGRTDQVFTMTRSNGSWGPEQQLTNESQYASNPTQAFTSNGTEFVFWVLGSGIYGCAFVTSCTPHPVFTDGFNSFPIAASSLAYPGSVFLMWSHSDSSDLSPSSVFISRLGLGGQSTSPWAWALPLVVVLAVLAIFLVTNRGREPSQG